MPSATVLHLVPPAPSELEPEQAEVLALLDKFREQVVTGAVTPRQLILCVVEDLGPDREKSYVIATPMRTAEIIGNLFSLATAITMEPT